MTVDVFVEELKGHWSWVYDMYVSKLYDRQWAQWELLTIGGTLSVLLLLKVWRRRRKAAVRFMRANRGSGDPSIIGVKLVGKNGNGRNGEDLHEADESDAGRLESKHQRWTTVPEESDWSEQPVRDLRREIIKRDQTEARLEREVSELVIANERLEREVAGLKAANERLLRQVTDAKREEELSKR